MEATLPLAIAAVVAGSRPVRIPSLRIDVMPIHPFVLLALALEGGLASALVGLAGILGAAAARKPPPAGHRLAFNLVTSVLATCATTWIAHRLGAHTGDPVTAWLWPMTAATATYFAVSTGLVAAAISFEKRQGYFATWNRSLRWTAAPYAVGLTVAVAALAVCEVSYVAGIALTIAPCWCLILLYRTEAVRQEAQSVHGEATSTSGTYAGASGS
jgi:hypothetical protein